MNTLLLDTHTLVWLLENDQQLGIKAREFVDKMAEQGAEQGTIAVSAITFWEIALLQQRQRLELKQSIHNWREMVLNLGIVEIPVTGDIGIMATELENFHPDPADRIIVATACLHNATLITADRAILGWSGALQCINARK